MGVRCQQGQTGKALITLRSFDLNQKNERTNFQALIDRDHQEFEFVITNLTGEGMIKIDIMKNDNKVVDVDPGAAKGRVNQVNELHEYQSYEVRCDQKDNLSFVLDAIKKESGEYLTVKESESKEVPQHTKYWISVVPENGKLIILKLYCVNFSNLKILKCINIYTFYLCYNNLHLITKLYLK